MWFTRKRHYRILDHVRGKSYSILDDAPDSARSSSESQGLNPPAVEDEDVAMASTKQDSKRRVICGITVRTPNTDKYRRHFHSRILQRFPFLIEMFYWVINYLFYRMTSVMAQRIFADSGIWQVSQAHALSVLEFEEFGWLRFLFPIREQAVQMWFMNGHQGALTFLNRVYALIHIPGTVG